MASIITHGVAALTIGIIFPSKNINSKIIAAGIVLSMLPDADVMGFAYGIPYESMFGHRGFTHSICFAALAAFLISTLFFINKQYSAKAAFTSIFMYLFLCTLSHGILDACTSGGLGVGFFIPFSESRYFFSWRPIQVSPIGFSNFFSSWGVAVIKSEVKYVWFPCSLLIILNSIIKKFTHDNRPHSVS